MRVFPLFSPEDQDLVRPEGWRTLSGYASEKRVADGRAYLYVCHRVVLSRKLGRPLARGEICDHINRNRLDNRRENLRVTTIKGNNQNQKNNNKLGWRGVGNTPSGKFVATVSVWNRTLYLGRFSGVTEAGLWAARARRELGYLDNA